MKYGKINDMHASRVVLGVPGFGTVYTQSESEAILRCYMDKGGNILDTALVYMNWMPTTPEKSASEKMLGRILRANPAWRDQLLVCTKGAHFELNDSARTPRVNEGCITYDINESYKNLDLGPIDLYWLHRDNPTYPIALIMDALFEAQDAGKIRHYGASNWTADRLTEANRYAASVGRAGFCASQVQYSYVYPLEAGAHGSRCFDEKAEGPVYQAEKLALFCFTSQAGGYMSKIRAEKPLKAGMRQAFDCPVNRQRADRAATVAQAIGAESVEQVGLAYLHALPYNTFTIISHTSLDQLNQSLDCDFDLSPEQIRFLATDDLPLPPHAQ